MEEETLPEICTESEVEGNESNEKDEGAPEILVIQEEERRLEGRKKKIL